MKSTQEENTVKKENASAQSSAEGSAESSESASASAEREKTTSEPKVVAAPKVVSEFKETVTSGTTQNEPAPPEKTLSETMVGEALAPCSETEWLTSDTALPTELLKVQKDQRRVTVFAPPVVDVIGETKEVKETKTNIKQDFEGKIGLVAELVANFARLLGNDETAKEGVEV